MSLRHSLSKPKVFLFRSIPKLFRFQRRECPSLEVIYTDQKGCGLKALTKIKHGQFIIEYVGEIVSKTQFLKRTSAYQKEGITHHYFMSLNQGEIIDATRKGGLSRFINHSCDPNSILQKWVVGAKMRMGIFALKNINPGEEITFDYKFERYGAEPQKCFCGAISCKGFIGRTSHVKSNLIDEIPDHISDDIDVDDEIEQENAAPRRKPRPKHHHDDDEWRAEPKPKGLRSVEQVCTLARLMLRCVGKPVVVDKLLDKIQHTRNIVILRKFVQLHGLIILKNWLIEYKNDESIILNVLKVLKMLPISTRNTIENSNIEDLLMKIMENSYGKISSISSQVLAQWKALRTVYKIPKVKPSPSVESNCPDSITSPSDTSEVPKKRSMSRDLSEDETTKRRNFHGDSIQNQAGLGIMSHNSFFDSSGNAISISRHRNNNNNNQNDSNHFKRNQNSSRQHSSTNINNRNLSTPNAKKNSPSLPPNWKIAYADNGHPYYYHAITKKTQWEFPTPSMDSDLRTQNESPLQINPSTTNTSNQLIEATHNNLNFQSSQTIKKYILNNPTSTITLSQSPNNSIRRKISMSPIFDSPPLVSNLPDSIKTSRSKSDEIDHNMSPSEKVKGGSKEALHSISQVVVNCFSKHKDDLDRDTIKKHARKVTHLIFEKEEKSHHFDIDKLINLSDEKKKKIKSFADDYIKKLIRRKP